MADKTKEFDTLYCFLDTNILHHFQTFDEVDWPSVLNANQVCLVLAPNVLREVDKHKDDYTNERRRKRARMLLSKLKYLLESETTTEQLPQVRRNVTLMALSQEPMINWTAEHLDPNVDDDRLLASVLDFSHQHASGNVLLLTDDFPVRLKAKTHGVQALAPEGLVYPIEPPSQKQALLKKVEGLVPGVNISVYRDNFDKPTYINHLREKNAREYIFVNPHFYLKAVVDINGAVQYFAVTIRDETCKPVFKSPDHPINQTSFHLTLGANTFSDIPGLPEYIAGCLGAHNISYYETRWLGNPGHYKHFGFGFNQAGYLSNNAGAYLSMLANTPHLCPGTSAYTEQDLVALDDFRTKVAFNTYAVSAPFVTIEDYAGSNLGVDYYQVRALNI